MKLVIMDRDGVINHESAAYIKSVEEWRPIPESLEAIARLTRADYRVVVATNQSGVGRGLYDEAALHKVHEYMQESVISLGGRIDKVFYCPHLPDAHCLCRKPQPGMLHQIAEHYNCDLTGIPFIGDADRDIIAARAVGCEPILVLTGFGQKTVKHTSLVKDILVFDNLARAVDHLLKFSDKYPCV